MTTSNVDAAYDQLELGLVDYLSGGGRLAVVKAPPGSGKTHVLVSALLSLVEQGKTIAVAAQTNSQADDICKRIADRGVGTALTRFASKGHITPNDFPPGASWITDKKDLTDTAGVTVSTVAKWALTKVTAPFDLLAVDEAWQLKWADLMQCAVISDRFLLIGDPGQIPPVVTIDVRRWETSPRAPHSPAPEIVLADEGLVEVAYMGSLPACRRLPCESVDFIKPFYDFDFVAYAEPGERALDLPADHLLHRLGDGMPIAVTVPTPSQGPPIEADHELASAAANIVHSLLGCDARARTQTGFSKALEQADIGVTSSHRVMNAAIEQALGGECPAVRVDTPERWQGLERPVMVAIHPLSGVTDPSAFALETGRLCVMASRHQAALIILARDHIGDTLANFVPRAEQAPGKPDITGRGHEAHSLFWQQLVDADRVIAIS